MTLMVLENDLILIATTCGNVTTHQAFALPASNHLHFFAKIADLKNRTATMVSEVAEKSGARPSNYMAPDVLQDTLVEHEGYQEFHDERLFFSRSFNRYGAPCKETRHYNTGSFALEKAAICQKSLFNPQLQRMAILHKRDVFQEATQVCSGIRRSLMILPVSFHETLGTHRKKVAAFIN